MAPSSSADLQSQCDLLRSLHRPGDPLLLPNAWDVATGRAVVAAGFHVVATSSGGVAATLGYEDQEGAPAEEMLAAAARIARGVEVPVTVDAEAGCLLCRLLDEDLKPAATGSRSGSAPGSVRAGARPAGLCLLCACHPRESKGFAPDEFRKRSGRNHPVQ